MKLTTDFKPFTVLELLKIQLAVMRSVITAHGLWGEYDEKYAKELKRRQAEKELEAEKGIKKDR